MRPCTYWVNPNRNIGLSVYIETKESEKNIVPGRKWSNLEGIIRIRNYFSRRP